jgi:AcrR family transcriptional regulator
VVDGAERPYHHGNLRTALLEQAERALAERGAGGLSLRELARAVGVSHAAPRRHFADRRALLDALAQDGFERLARDLGDAVAGAGPSFEARLAAGAAAYVTFATRHGALLELMFAGKHRGDGDVAALRAAADRAFEVMLELMVEGQATGALRAGDPERVGIVLFASLQGLAALVNGGMLPRERVGELTTEAVEQLLVGLRPRRGAAQRSPRGRSRSSSRP